MNSHEQHSSKFPDAIPHKKAPLSIVWVIPLIALAIGGWLAIQAIRDKGPVITITFPTAEGLEAGKTKIKYRDVEIGKVEKISLSTDISKIIVTASLVKGSKKYLTDKTKFWIVRAQMRGGSISGLSTVLSGAYIGIDPNTDGLPSDAFQGLENPPVVTLGQPGKHFHLHAQRLGSVDFGTPVYYRQIKVGQVVGYTLSPDGKGVDIQIFIEDPHDKRITEKTTFWNASGINVAIGASGVKVHTESLISVLSGGIAFDQPDGIPEGREPASDYIFRLFPDFDSSLEKMYSFRCYWLLLFDQSVSGLTVGSPVELHGIKVGEVTSIDLEYDALSKKFRVPVIIAVEPERVQVINSKGFKGFTNNSEIAPSSLVKLLVEERGLRGQLKTTNLLTGQLAVDLIFPKQDRMIPLSYHGNYPIVPTVPGSLDQLQESLASITTSLERLQFDQIGSDIHTTLQDAQLTLQQLSLLLKNINRTTSPQLNNTLKQIQRTVSTLQNNINEESPIKYKLNKTLDELILTLRSVRGLSSTLEREPQSLLFGKEQKDHD